SCGSSNPMRESGPSGSRGREAGRLRTPSLDPMICRPLGCAGRSRAMGMIREPTSTVRPATLVEGQRLDQSTLHELYVAIPREPRAELIGGVVYMPSPCGPEHGRALTPAAVWLSYYQENTPGVEALVDTSTALYPKGEPQPDALLRILPEFGGRTQT